MTTNPQEFGATFKSFMDKMVAAAPDAEPPLVRRLTEHFGVPPGTLPIVRESFPQYDHANVQTGLDSWFAEADRSAEAIGVNTPHHGYMGVHLADVVAPNDRFGAPQEGPVEYTTIHLDADRSLSCIQCGLLLIRDAGEPLACLVQVPRMRHMDAGVSVEVMARTTEPARRLLADLRKRMRERNVYRGKALSLDSSPHEGLSVKFHDLPAIGRERIILPPGILERVERQTIGFSAHAEQLRAAGRHLRRGLLLFGPPGTGKTFTAMYLATQMKDRTVILVTGREQGLIQQVCTMARYLQPATVILEDVDLIAESRDMDNGKCTGPLLFELLNEMDGLAPDHDIIFLLTTNRPDRLEPALAARPGRIDQAIEIPLPDAECRQRLFDLYLDGVRAELRDRPHLVSKTTGASAAFIKELVRRATLFACEEAETPVVTDTHFEDAIHEIVVSGGRLTKSLLGFADETPEPT